MFQLRTPEMVEQARKFWQPEGTKSVKEVIQGLTGLVVESGIKYKMGQIIEKPLMEFDAEYINCEETERCAHRRLGWEATIFESPSEPGSVWEFCGSLVSSFATHIEMAAKEGVRYHIGYRKSDPYDSAKIALMESARVPGVLSEVVLRFHNRLSLIRNFVCNDEAVFHPFEERSK